MTNNNEETGINEHPKISDYKKAAYRSLLPGLEYGLKCLLHEINEMREKLGYAGPVVVEGLDEELTAPKRGGITAEGRRKLAEMMRRRWEDAKKEGVHVSEYKPPKKPAANKGRKTGPENHS